MVALFITLGRCPAWEWEQWGRNSAAYRREIWEATLQGCWRGASRNKWQVGHQPQQAIAQIPPRLGPRSASNWHISQQKPLGVDEYACTLPVPYSLCEQKQKIQGGISGNVNKERLNYSWHILGRERELQRQKIVAKHNFKCTINQKKTHNWKTGS